MSFTVIMILCGIGGLILGIGCAVLYGYKKTKGGNIFFKP